MSRITLAMLHLRVLNGTERDTTIHLDRANILIGRDKSCDLRLRDTYVSRHHCWVEQQEGRWCVRDLGSRNGTWVNGARVTGPATLDAGTVIKVGRTFVRVQDESRSATDTPPWPMFDLDHAHKTARLDGQLVLPPLTEPQWRALLLLWERRGEVVSHEELASHIWPEIERDDARRHVDRLIERIRMRLGDVEAILIQPCASGYMLPANGS